MKSAAFAAVLLVACDDVGNQVPPPTPVGCISGEHQLTSTTFHGDPARLGWSSQETTLTPTTALGLALGWSSTTFDSTMVGGAIYPGRAYASPLYADDMTLSGSSYAGAQVSALFEATSNGFVYAINAFDSPCTTGSLVQGTVLWQTTLVTPAVVPGLDGGIPLGTLSTPVLDLQASPPTLYVTAMDATGGVFVWKAFALDAQSGTTLPGWPVSLDSAAITAVNGNGPGFFDADARNVSQRGALALSPEGDRLYVTFGSYAGDEVGWIVAVNTQTPGVVASFSAAPDDASGTANGGMWGAAGPSIDAHGEVYMTTAASDPSFAATPNTWGSSLLRWTKDLVLDATYTPWDFCMLDAEGIGLGASSAVLLPTLTSLQTTTPDLVAFGGQDGVAYLLDQTNIQGSLTARPACSTSSEDAAGDLSLLPPTADGNYCDVPTPAVCTAPASSTMCVPGPVVAFGPPGDVASGDDAKMHTTPAFFHDVDGNPILYFSGVTKASLCDVDDVPPSIVRMRVASNMGQAAYLVRDAADTSIRFINPSSPVVTSNGPIGPIVWVLDENAESSAPLTGPTTPGPILYAVDGTTMGLLFRSNEGDLDVGGKYATPVVVHGTVFVATDRIQTFVLN